MESLSFSSWLHLALALLALVLIAIQDTLAIKCYQCAAGEKCSLKECSPDEVCYSEYGKSTTKKECTPPDVAKYVVEGLDTCKDGLFSHQDQINSSKILYEEVKKRDPNDPQIANKTADEYAKEQWEKAKPEMGEDAEKGYRGCTCSKDACNEATTTTFNLEHGKFATVIFLALAALVYGFLGSQ